MPCRRAVTRLVCGGAALFLLVAACDSSEQGIHIVAQDFRFTPDEVRLVAGQPVRLVIRNEGREHEFMTPLLVPHAGAGTSLPGSVPVVPNQNAEADLRTRPGSIPFIARSRVMPA